MPEREAQLFTAMFRRSPIGMALVSLQGQFMTVNEALCRMLGYTQAELLALTFQDITHPEDLDSDLGLLRRVLAREMDQYELRKRYWRKDGQLIWIELHVSLILDEAGAPAFFVSQIQDITAQVETEAQLQEVNERLRLALEATQDGLWDWRLPGRELFVSDAFRSQLGFDRHEPVSLDAWLARVHPDDLPALQDSYRAHLAGHRALHVQYRAQHGSGEWRFFQVRGQITAQDDQGQPLRVTGTQTDVTEQVRTTQDLQLLLDNLPALIGYWDTTLHNRFGNPTYLAWFGQTPAQVRGQHIRDVIGEELYAQNRPMIERVLAGETRRFERQITDASGQPRAIELVYVPDMQGGEVRGFFSLGTDITARKVAERALTEQRELARVTLSSIGDGVVTTDPQGRVTFLNPTAERMTGWTLAEAAGQPIEAVMALLEEGTRTELANPLRRALQERVTLGLAANTLLRSRAGHHHSIEDSAAPILNEQGELLGAVLVFHDVSEARAMAVRMSHLAQHDALTDLPNRVLLRDRVSQAISRARRQGTRFAVLFLDLDHFKNVNDSLGHHVGDELLKAISARLRGVLRASDTVSRQGGDEFIVLLPDMREADHVEHVIAKLTEAVTAPYQVAGHHLEVGFSVGVALYPDDGESTDVLLQHADAAMYRAKAEGRGRHRFFSRALHQAILARQSLQAELRQAFERREFSLVYQPKVNLWTREVLGAEALLRWVRPDGRAVSPLDFIPLAEESGLIVPLGAWVLETACQQSRAWTQACGHNVPVSVNISPLQFADPGFLETVQRYLQGTGLTPGLLELELTESMLMADIERVQQTLGALRHLGVCVSIDDFGTGYSSLSYLRAFPVNTLKIDRSFLKTVPDDPQAVAVVEAVVALGRSLNLGVIAEGVETPEQARSLLNLDCAAMQGYLFGRPMPPGELLTWLRDWHAQGAEDPEPSPLRE
ncbi:sensor domain-containing protein [Deinococcus aquaedulcis]|uniref:sensor domain-containing protein n=1 Tax=Deinococcus aquaedulcis TaxID=2840455 RepID=UPI001C832EB3|nr:EAL domain-containing protein [Deinococcus aquaedulcis]